MNPEGASGAPRTSFRFGDVNAFSASNTGRHGCHRAVLTGEREPPVQVVAPAARQGCPTDPANACTVSSTSSPSLSASSTVAAIAPPLAQSGGQSASAASQTPRASSPLMAASASPASPELEALLTGLDPSQRAAVCVPVTVPLLIQAGAGSGKTQTMACRIAFLLLSGVPARCILGICFTRQAAETLRQRVRAVLPGSLQSHANALTLKTLHAFGLQCLRRFGVMGAETEVFDAGRQRRLARRVVEQHAVHNKSADAVEALVTYVNKAKTKKELPVAQANPSVQDGYLFSFYESILHDEESAVDFGDLQRLLFDLLRPAKGTNTTTAMATGGGQSAQHAESVSESTCAPSLPSGSQSGPSPACDALRRQYTHIVVDEFQDFNEIQVEILAHLAGDACRVTCVGDPNQCIYEWRGAMPAVFTAWRRRFPQTDMRVLQVNYRSDGEIVSALNGLVRTEQQPHCHRLDAKIKLLRCDTDDDAQEAVLFAIEHLLVHGARHAGTTRSPVRALSYGDVAVLCRTRRRVQLYADLLTARGISVRQLKGVVPDSISLVRALLAYLKLTLNPHVDSEVRIALTSAPQHLSVGAAKTFFLSLSAVSEERRLAAGGSASAHTETSFYSILRDVVFHNFSEELFPKLTVSRPNQKVLRNFVRVVMEGHERLQRAATIAGDVGELIRVVAMEAGFDGEKTVSVRVAAGSKRARGAAPAKTGGAAGGRHSSGHSLAADVAAELSTVGEPSRESQSSLERQLAALPCHKNSRADAAGEDDQGVVYSVKEEAELLNSTHVPICQLLLDAHDDVMAQLRREQDEEEKEKTEGEGEPRTHDGGGAERHASGRPTPALVLRRVLDQFVTLLPSDDFGTLRGADGGAPAAVVCRQVTVSTVHRAKGMEWPAVVLPDCWLGEFPVRTTHEERRVFYVAMSRAMTDLVLVSARRSHDARYTRHRSAGPPGGACGSHPSPTDREERSGGADAGQAGGELMETPFLESMKGKEVEELEYRQLLEARLRAAGAF